MFRIGPGFTEHSYLPMSNTPAKVSLNLVQSLLVQDGCSKGSKVGICQPLH